MSFAHAVALRRRSRSSSFGDVGAVCSSDFESVTSMEVKMWQGRIRKMRIIENQRPMSLLNPFHARDSRPFSSRGEGFGEVEDAVPFAFFSVVLCSRFSGAGLCAVLLGLASDRVVRPSTSSAYCWISSRCRFVRVLRRMMSKGFGQLWSATYLGKCT